MEDKIMNTVDNAMKNPDVMTEVCKNGKHTGWIALAAGAAAAVAGAVVLVVRKVKKRKFEKTHAIVEVNTAETVTDEEVKG